MKIKKSVRIIIIAIFIVLGVLVLIFNFSKQKPEDNGQTIFRFRSQEEEEDDLTTLKSIDLNFQSNNSELFYSFIPDGSGIIYVEDVKRGNTYDSEKYIFYLLNFKDGKQEKIHEVTFYENFEGEKPFVYWVDSDSSILGGQVYLGLCGYENPSGTVLFNTKVKEKILFNCVNRSRTGEDYFQKFSDFYSYYSKNKQFYDIFRIKYSTEYSDTSYVFISNNHPIYLFGNCISDCATTKEKLLYEEFDKNSKDSLTNAEIETKDYPKIYDTKIYSRDKKYYFILKNVDYLGCANVDCPQKQYLEIYNTNGRLIRKIYLGKTGDYNIGPKYTGYVDFWSNDNKIILVKSMGGRSQFKIYFIEPEN
jgi:hypothetical protein